MTGVLAVGGTTRAPSCPRGGHRIRESLKKCRLQRQEWTGDEEKNPNYFLLINFLFFNIFVKSFMAKKNLSLSKSLILVEDLENLPTKKLLLPTSTPVNNCLHLSLGQL